jgi:hypothetical protein
MFIRRDAEKTIIELARGFPVIVINGPHLRDFCYYNRCLRNFF